MMTITRALKELKLLEKRISDNVGLLTLIDVKQKKHGEKALKTSMPVDKFTEIAKASYQSINDLINRRNEIKKKIVESNATTIVKIGNQTMSVAEAIDQKSFIKHKETLLACLRRQKSEVDKEIENGRAVIDRSIEDLVSKNTSKDRKVDKDDFDKIAAPFIEANELHMIDPIDISEKIKRLSEEIENFKSDIDIVLSESNSKTEINI